MLNVGQPKGRLKICRLEAKAFQVTVKTSVLCTSHNTCFANLDDQSNT